MGENETMEKDDLGHGLEGRLEGGDPNTTSSGAGDVSRSCAVS